MIETPVPVRVPVEPVTPIRPSEALRLGRLIRPRQVFGPLWEGEDGACALGAIYAAGGLGAWDNGPAVCPERPRPRWFDRFRRQQSKCAGRASFFAVIAHLNDDHHWNDDQIASWLIGLGL